MDPVNLSGTQSTPSDSKSCGGIRSPTGCAYCGLTDYPLNIPQAYSFTALCPGLSKCKHSQDKTQDDFAVPHPVFTGFPFQHPFFYNSKMPPNFCCSQKFVNDDGKSQGQKQPKREHEMSNHRIDHCIHQQKAKLDQKDTDKKIIEDAPKNNHIHGPEIFLPYATSIESHLNAAFQRCVCGDTFPWVYSPFFVPVLSYCFLWNSQAPASNMLPKPHNGYLTENVCEKNSETVSRKKYQPPSESQERLRPVKQVEQGKTAVRKGGESTETIFYAQKSLRVKDINKTEMEKEDPAEMTDLNSGISSAALLSGLLNCRDRIDPKSADQDEIAEELKIYSDGTCEEDDGVDSDGEDISTLRDELETEDLLRPGVKGDGPILDFNENHSKDDYHGFPDPDSFTNLKSASKSSEQSLDDSLSENQTNFGAVVNDFNLAGVSNQQSDSSISAMSETSYLKSNIFVGKNNSEYEDHDTSKINFKDVTSFKKCIKNFTLAAKINTALSKDVPRSGVGDVVESLDNYKMRISRTDENRSKIPREDKLETKELLMSGVSTEANETKHSLKIGDLNSQENQSSANKQKSGIAKYLNPHPNPYPRASKSNILKSTKISKNDSIAKQNSLVKHKLCFVPSEKSTISGNDSHPKVQKAKNCVVVQNRIAGSETQPKLHPSGQPKKENILTKRVGRPVVALSNSSKKAVKPQ